MLNKINASKDKLKFIPTNFKTNKIVKIWFTNEKACKINSKFKTLLGLINEPRLRYHRTQFRDHEITLISNFKDFSDVEKKN